MTWPRNSTDEAPNTHLSGVPQVHSPLAHTTQFAGFAGDHVRFLKKIRMSSMREMAEDVVHHSLKRCTTVLQAEGRVMNTKEPNRVLIAVFGTSDGVTGT